MINANFRQRGPHRPAARRVVLWDELEQAHAQLGMAPPTATLTIEDLEADVERLRLQVARQQDGEGTHHGKE